MTHLNGGKNAEAAAAVDDFRRQMKRHFICFDPGDIEEKGLAAQALAAAEQGHRTVQIGPDDQVQTSQVLDIVADIDGQIYVRDFKLIDQSDMIISLVPALDDGRPGLSSGVERELQHAHEAAKDVFVIWLAKVEPSPFITETATRLFKSTAEAVDWLARSFGPPPPRGGLFC